MCTMEKREKKNLLMDATGCDADFNSQLKDKFRRWRQGEDRESSAGYFGIGSIRMRSGEVPQRG